MRLINRYILLFAVSVGCASALYFVLLFLHLPVLVIAAIAIAICFFLHRWMLAEGPGGAVNDGPDGRAEISLLALIILLVVFYIICFSAYNVARKYGEWDAVMTWNVDAKYLSSRGNWRKLFQNTEYSHLDYPLCLPGILAFFHRLALGNGALIIPFVFSLLITLCIPVLVYLEFAARNLVVAVLTLILFVDKGFYMFIGTLQYADVLLAFFFLCSFMCMAHISEGRKYVTLSLIFLCCAAWTKNEGAIIGVISLLGYAGVYCSKENRRATWLVLGVTIALLVLMKFVANTQNDLIKESGGSTLTFLLDKERYMMVYDSFLFNVNGKFYYVKFALYIYLIVCLYERRFPDRQMLILIVCIAAYFMIYILTPKPLEWHLRTSQDRLMTQLMPALIYVIANKLVRLKVVLT